MMVYDAFTKRVISPNKQVINKLASIMMLLQKEHLKNYGNTSEIIIVNGWLSLIFFVFLQTNIKQ